MWTALPIVLLLGLPADCVDVADAAGDLESLSVLVRTGLNKESRAKISKAAESLSDLGASIAEGEEGTAEERKLGESLQAAADNLDRAVEDTGDPKGLQSAFGQVVERVDQLSDVCFLRRKDQ